jgi:glycosidase
MKQEDFFWLCPKLIQSYLRNMMKTWILLACTLLALYTGSQAQSVSRIDPPNWFNNMQNPTISLLIMGKDLKECTSAVCDKPQLMPQAIRPSANKDIIFLDLRMEKEIPAGKYTITLKGGKKELKFEYEIKAKQNITRTGLGTSDFIYLLMPDRFANGNTANDQVSGMEETCTRRDSILCRHGGDLAGIKEHIPYIKSLGATAIWLNPVQQNNQPHESYHGYAITDHYRIDERLGSMKEYTDLVNEAHKRDLKMVMDLVFNHTGNMHYLYRNMPDSSWFHHFKSFTRTNYRASTLMDPYAAPSDRERMQNAWFDKHMPDLNQKNAQLARYLIQNTLWWVETAGLDGLRIDTWAYPDPGFMDMWYREVKTEYPNLAIFGEVWDHGPAVQAWFTTGNGLGQKIKVPLESITDFQFYYAINEIAQGKQGWTEGVARMYYTLAQDFLYRDPNKNIIFLDNHDLSRYWSMCGENMNRFKTGINLLMTMRGIPVMQYGTEILMKNFANPDARVRNDFPGGWAGDKENKFEAAGRNAQEQEAFDYISKLSAFRASSVALTSGKLMQYVPEDGVYVYFRYLESQLVMVVINSSDKKKEIDLSRYKESTARYQKGRDVVSGAEVELKNGLSLEAGASVVLELKP